MAYHFAVFQSDVSSDNCAINASMSVFSPNVPSIYVQLSNVTIYTDLHCGGILLFIAVIKHYPQKCQSFSLIFISVCAGVQARTGSVEGLCKHYIYPNDLKTQFAFHFILNNYVIVDRLSLYMKHSYSIMNSSQIMNIVGSQYLRIIPQLKICPTDISWIKEDSFQYPKENLYEHTKCQNKKSQHTTFTSKFIEY